MGRGSKSWLILLFLMMLMTVHSHAFNPQKEANRESKQVLIQVDKIKKALWDSGFKIMSLMMDSNLRLISRDKVEFNNNGTVTLYNHTAITMFIPQDDGVKFIGNIRTSFELQIATSKIKKKAFDSGLLSQETVLGNLLTGPPPPRKRHNSNLVVTGHGEINYADITHWDIYNDRKVVVHGVNYFFPLIDPFEFPLVRISTPYY